jgi:hypothetical protein
MMMKLRFLAPIMVVTACGGGNAETQHPTLVTPPPAATASVTPESLEKDPVALFPGGALGMFSLDLHAFYASQSAGTVAAQVAEKYFPIGAEAGFSASRDLDRVLGGIYSMQGVDVLATLIGRFDEAKIVQAAQAKTQTRIGVPIVASTYANRTLYTVSDVGFTVVSAHLVLAGTKTTIKRALDRMRDARLGHDVPGWMLQTIQTPAAAGALALNLDATKGGIPLASVMGGFPIKGTDGITALRLLGNFQPPGMHIAGSATYVDEAHAKAGADGLKAFLGSTVVSVGLSALGVSLHDVNVTPAQSDAQVAFSLDDASLRNLIGRLPALASTGP